MKGLVSIIDIRRQFEESGTFGDPTMATKETGETMLTAMISDLADIIVQVVKSRT